MLDIIEIIINDKEKLSSVISMVVAIVILIASFSQWWNITFNGNMITKNWVKYLFCFLILSLLISLILLIV
jgi:hypothetical protein